MIIDCLPRDLAEVQQMCGRKDRNFYQTGPAGKIIAFLPKGHKEMNADEYKIHFELEGGKRLVQLTFKKALVEWMHGCRLDFTSK